LGVMNEGRTLAMVKEKGEPAEAEGESPAEANGAAVQVCREVADLLEWKREARGHKGPPPRMREWRDRVRGFSRKEKGAVLLGLLLSDCIRDDQLDAMIEVVMCAGGVVDGGDGARG
jgi:hypothetical protein